MISCVDEPLDGKTGEQTSEPGDEETGEVTSAVITNPTQGGPFASNQTHKCTNHAGSYCYGAGYPGPELTASATVIGLMDAAALNWGCSNQAGLFTQVPSAVTGGFVKWYGVISNSQACGAVYWNNAKQAAYFVANADRQCNTLNCNAPLNLNGTSNKLFARYTALSGPSGVLGLPISNPVPYGWNNATYQLFTGGLLTYQSGQAGAFYAGGTGSRKTVTDRYLALFGATPSNGPAIYALTKDIADTCVIAGQTTCTALDDTGDVLVYQDKFWGANGYVVGKDSSSRAFDVPAPFYSLWNNNITPPIYNGGTPWSGSTYGFPADDVQLLRTTQNGQGAFVQVFDHSGVIWQPKGCPNFVPSCPSAGPTYCTTYGTLSTNYLATDLDATAVCYP